MTDITDSALPEFSAGPQIRPEQVAGLAAMGYKSLLCARPDGEDPGQPAFAEIEAAASAAGLRAVHIPVSGMLTEGALIRMEQALEGLPRPIFAYCRSGARAQSLYAAVTNAGR